MRVFAFFLWLWVVSGRAVPAMSDADDDPFFDQFLQGEEGTDYFPAVSGETPPPFFARVLPEEGGLSPPSSEDEAALAAEAEDAAAVILETAAEAAATVATPQRRATIAYTSSGPLAGAPASPRPRVPSTAPPGRKRRRYVSKASAKNPEDDVY